MTTDSRPARTRRPRWTRRAAARISRTGLRTAAIVLRAAALPMAALAARADRGLRSLSARQCSFDAHDLLSRAAARSTRPESLHEQVLGALTERRGWLRLDRDRFAYEFGARRTIVSLPASLSPAELASVVTRAEIKVLHGDLDGELVRHLQELASRELSRLFATWRRS